MTTYELTQKQRQSVKKDGYVMVVRNGKEVRVTPSMVKQKTRKSTPVTRRRCGCGVDFDKHVWEGWTVGDFIEELEPQLDMIMTGRSWKKPITITEELKQWCKDNQPYYKKYVPGVVKYFAYKYGIR